MRKLRACTPLLHFACVDRDRERAVIENLNGMIIARQADLFLVQLGAIHALANLDLGLLCFFACEQHSTRECQRTNRLAVDFGFNDSFGGENAVQTLIVQLKQFPLHCARFRQCLFEHAHRERRLLDGDDIGIARNAFPAIFKQHALLRTSELPRARRALHDDLVIAALRHRN